MSDYDEIKEPRLKRDVLRVVTNPRDDAWEGLLEASEEVSRESLPLSDDVLESASGVLLLLGELEHSTVEEKCHFVSLE